LRLFQRRLLPGRADHPRGFPDLRRAPHGLPHPRRRTCPLARLRTPTRLFRPRRTRPHPPRPRGMGRHASARRRRIPLVPEAPFPHLPRLPPRTTLPLALAFAPPRTHPARPVLGIPAPLRFPQNQTRPSPPASAPRPHRRPPS